MTFKQLTGKDNPLLKTIRKLSRHSGEQMIAEGVRVLEEAEAAQCAIDAVVISESFGENEREQKLLRSWQSRSARIYRISAALFRSISAVETPQGAIALLRVPKYSLEMIAPENNALILCAAGIQDPGNMGTLIRTASAAGAHLVCTTPGSVSARNPKVLRASAGAFFRIPVIEHLPAEELLAWRERRSIRIYRTDIREGIAPTRADLVSPCAIVLGNEGNGLNNAAFSQMPSLRIPMSGNAESLNVAAAGAIILFEAFRQREAAAS